MGDMDGRNTSGFAASSDSVWGLAPRLSVQMGNKMKYTVWSVVGRVAVAKCGLG